MPELEIKKLTIFVERFPGRPEWIHRDAHLLTDEIFQCRPEDPDHHLPYRTKEIAEAEIETILTDFAIVMLTVVPPEEFEGWKAHCRQLQKGAAHA